MAEQQQAAPATRVDLTTMTVRLVKRATDDGLVEIHDDVPLGREYVVSRVAEPKVMYNTVRCVEHVKMCVLDVREGGWIPMELLEPVGLLPA